MKRRQFVTAAAGTAALSVGAPNVLAASRKKHRWRLVTVIPKTLAIWGPGIERFSKLVKEMSEGRLSIKVYGAGELVPPFESFDAVRTGKVQMAHSAAYYWQGKMPASVFFCAVPFGMNAAGMRAWLSQGGGQKLWDELYAPHGVFALPAGNTGVQMGGWFKKEIKTLADYKGLKIRIPGLGGKTVEKAGAKPILVAGGEIFTNLATGVIDATEWVGPYHDYLMGFHKAAKYYYYPGWHEPGPVLELIINKKAWSQLSDDLKAIVNSAAASLDRDMYSEWLVKDAEYLNKIRQEGKVKIQPFPKDVLTGLKKLADDVKAEVAKSSPLAGRIFQSATEFQKTFEAHQQVTEWSYINAVRV